MFHVNLQGCIPVICIFPNVYSSIYIVIAYIHIQGVNHPTDHPSAPLCLFYQICKGIKGWFCANSLQLTVRVDNSVNLWVFSPTTISSSTIQQVLVTNSNTKKNVGVLERTIFFKNPENKTSFVSIFNILHQFCLKSSVLSVVSR